MAPAKSLSFDLSLIGEADKRNLCSTFLTAVQRFYADPANCERFERWKQQKQWEAHKPAITTP